MYLERGRLMDKTIVIGVRIGENGNYVKFIYDYYTHNIRFDNGRLMVWNIIRNEARLLVPESNVLFVETGENDE